MSQWLGIWWFDDADGDDDAIYPINQSILQRGSTGVQLRVLNLTELNGKGFNF